LGLGKGRGGHSACQKTRLFDDLSGGKEAEGERLKKDWRGKDLIEKKKIRR